MKGWPSRRPCERPDSPKAHAAYHWAATLDQLPQQWQLAGKNRTAKYRGTRQHAAAEGNAVPVREDTTVTIDDLRREGFGETLLSGVACVTHRHEEPYSDYVVRCKNHALARQVKLADLVDTSRPERCLLLASKIVLGPGSLI